MILSKLKNSMTSHTSYLRLQGLPLALICKINPTLTPQDVIRCFWFAYMYEYCITYLYQSLHTDLKQKVKFYNCLLKSGVG